MPSLENIAISASAGSGKTYQLTNRFIFLLHLTGRPERIVALTFTRTAAGEFFRKIIDKLAAAADDPKAAARLSRELGIEADPHRYRELLARLIRGMHRLNLQTLDSFFYRVVAAFSLELGLSGSLNLLDETAELRVRAEVRDRIVHRPAELDDALTEFWHAFRQATFGREQRSVDRIVAEFIDNLFPLYLETPDGDRWGRDEVIWPGGCPWKPAGNPDWDALADALTAALPEGLTQPQRNDFANAALKVRHYPVDEELNALLKNAFAAAPAILAGRATIKVRKALELPAPLCDALAAILRAVVWHHLHRALQNTRGVHRILRAYNQSYDRLVRRPGRLSFADLTHLLSPVERASPLQRSDPAARELMDYRLDGQYDHWLFDEFQDTSRPQWQVVANLIDEIIQDASGQRSFFYVGDTKQCLYLWRNGDDRLFHDILAHYEGAIRPHSLATSWRSAPAVLDAVNEVFDDPRTIAECFTPEVAARWERAWQRHHAADPNRDLPGYACWLHASEAEGPTIHERLLEILQSLDPIARGLSVGILVRKNDEANEIADFLRSHSRIPVHTGSAVRPATDNAAGVALLSLLRLAAHPGDDFARGHLRLVDESTDSPSLVNSAPRLRNRILQHGAESGVRWAAAQIEAHLPKDDRRHRERLDRLVAAARRFDGDERRDLDSLHRFLTDSTGGECDAGDAVIIETIHKSKGLEYDVVLLVEAETTSSLTIDRRIGACRNAAGEAEWILEPLRKDLMQADAQLARLYDQAESEGGFEALCRLYVAMTRAKRALYMITDPTRAQRGSLVKFLAQRLGTEAGENGLVWETGDPAWFKEMPSPSPPPSALHSPPSSLKSPPSALHSPPSSLKSPPSALHPPFPPAHPRLQLARPSDDASKPLQAAWLFDPDERSADFGTAVHHAFEQIEWGSPETALPDAEPAVAEALERCFDNEAIRALFTKPEGPCEVWRERAFTDVEGERFISGVFDRVHLYRDPQGKLSHAHIIDFKTDRIHETNTIEKAVEHHRPQLRAYRHALARITGLDKANIETTLVFTDAPAHVQVRG